MELYQKAETETTKESCEGCYQVTGNCRETKKWNSKLQSLQVQGEFSKLVCVEEDTKAWSWYVDGLPKCHLPFLLKASSDTLPTPMNRHRWRLRVSSGCPICTQYTCTTAHILSGCPAALEDGRFTWRHCSVLQNLWYSLQSQLTRLSKLTSQASEPQ